MKLQPQATLGASFGFASPIVGFRSDGLVLRERSDIGCVLLTAAVDAAEVGSLLSAAADVDLPLRAGRIKTCGECTALWLSPRSWLVHCALEDEVGLVERVNAIFPDKLVHAVGFTDALCWLELSGAAALDLLTEGAFLSLERGGLPIGHGKRTLIAHLAAVIIRERESAWLVAVERSRARYFAQWLSASAESREPLPQPY
jgi:heterotetrameric sarcosine oxidase gamma subunit